MKKNLGQQIKEIWKLGLRYINLHIDYAKLTASEKATIFLSGIALALIGIFIFAFVLFFIAVAGADLFGEVMKPTYANLCIAGIYIILFVIIYLLRKPLIVNPISRFVSKIIFSKEVENKSDKNNA